MKINSSQITMASASSYLLSEKQETQITNADGKLITSETVYHSAARQSAAQVEFITDGGDTVEIGQEGQQAVAVTSRAEQGMGLDMQQYMASVFEWAANAIDEVVARFESGLVEKSGIQLSRADEVDLDTLAIETGQDSFGRQVTIYKAVAAEYRSLARQMTPEDISLSTQTQIIEETSVQAGGTVRTADGRDISFTLDVTMARSVQSSSEERRTLRVVDPLVIDLTGTGAGLSSDKMDFDLDGDGDLERVAKTASGSAFLALDLNGDGEVNSGKELFGPSTGDGFKELALYDSDGNMWIDENDDIYDKLRVWIQDGSDNGILKKLSEAGIGAIHLGNIASAFTIQGDGGDILGQVRSAGMALTEDGEARAVQQIDLTV